MLPQSVGTMTTNRTEKSGTSRVLDNRGDILCQRDLAAPVLLSLKIQEFLSSIPGMPGGLISTTTPIFDPCPLGFYEGGSGSWQDCLWPY